MALHEGHVLEGAQDLVAAQRAVLVDIQALKQRPHLRRLHPLHLLHTAELVPFYVPVTVPVNVPEGLLPHLIHVHHLLRPCRSVRGGLQLGYPQIALLRGRDRTRYLFARRVRQREGEAVPAVF